MNWINKKVEKSGWLFAILAIVGIPPDIEWWQTHRSILMVNKYQIVLMVGLSVLISIGLVAGIFWIWYKIETWLKPKSDAAILAKIDEDINDKLITEIEELKKQLEPFLKRDKKHYTEVMHKLSEIKDLQKEREEIGSVRSIATVDMLSNIENQLKDKWEYLKNLLSFLEEADVRNRSRDGIKKRIEYLENDKILHPITLANMTTHNHRAIDDEIESLKKRLMQ